MNKNTLLLCCVLLTLNTGYAQEVEAEKPETGFYMRVGIGYAAPHGGSVQSPLHVLNNTDLFPVNGSVNISTLATNSSQTYDLKKASFSSGVQAVLALGYTLNKNIAIELTANAGALPSIYTSNIESIQTQTTYRIKIEQQADNPLFLSPSVVVQTGGRLNIYSRGGITLPVQSRITQSLDYNEQTYNPSDSTFLYRQVNVVESYGMRFSPGFTGALGVSFRAGKRAQLWAEAGIISMTLYYKSSEVVAYDQNGVSVLNQLAPSERITNYQYKGSVSNNGDNIATIQVPFSNFNISVGVKFDIQ